MIKFDPLNIHPEYHYYEKYKFPELTSKNVLTLGICASGSAGESWGVGSGISSPIDVRAKSADYVANKLEIPGFNGDLLLKYVLNYFNLTLSSGEKPLKYRIDELKLRGVFPTEPQQHLWYYAWKYALTTGSKRF